MNTEQNFVYTRNKREKHITQQHISRSRTKHCHKTSYAKPPFKGQGGPKHV